METKLVRIETYGMKCIKNKVSIDFTNSTISKEVKNFPVKAIFGMNGAGKSALINSIKIYKQLIFTKDCLRNEIISNQLNNLINKEINKFYFKIYFQVINDGINKLTTYSHEILLTKTNESFSIAYEKLYKLVGQTINTAEYKTIYEVQKGKLVNNSKTDFNMFLMDRTYNILSASTLPSLMLTEPISAEVSEKLNKTELTSDELILVAGVLALYNLNSKIVIYLEHSDDITIMRNIILDNSNGLKLVYEPTNISIDITPNEDIVHISSFPQYKDDVKKLEEFIKIFKHNLKKIDIVKKIEGKYYHCEKIFDYGDFKINALYESTGIRKMMKLHSFINNAIRGNYVFIDEMDNSINGVFLDKLIEFFYEYGKGVLCFTSHNLEPIRELKNKTQALLFLGETGKLVTWTRSGNANPANYYREGMIEDSPFNLDKYDFYNSFDVEE